MSFQTTKNPIPQNYGAFNANHGNRNNGDTTSQRESLNHGLIGDNISELFHLKLKQKLLRKIETYLG